MDSNEKEVIRLKLRKVSNEFLDALKLEIDSCIILADIERFGRLVSMVKIHMDSEVIRTLREKGFDHELSSLCKKAGEVLKS